jgi:hypothetical protein
VSENLAAEATLAMRARGITNPGEMLERAEPEAILRACRKWDAAKASGQRIGPGVLATWIRAGGVPPEEEVDPKTVSALKQRERRTRFEEYVRRFPEGSVIETHAELAHRCKWRDECDGRMVVFAASHETFCILAACDRCDEDAAYTLKALSGLARGQLTAVAA